MVSYFVLCHNEPLSEPCKRWFLALIHRSSSKSVTFFIRWSSRVLRSLVSLVRIYVSHTIVTVGSSFLVPRTSWITRGRVNFTPFIVIEEWIQISQGYQALPPTALVAKPSARHRPCPIHRRTFLL